MDLFYSLPVPTVWAVEVCWIPTKITLSFSLFFSVFNSIILSVAWLERVC